MQTIKQFLVGLVVIGLLVSPLQAQEATQPLCIYTSCGTGGGNPIVTPGPAVPSNISTGAIQNAQSVSKTVQGHVNIGRITSSDYVALSTSMKSVFLDWRNNAFTDHIANWLMLPSTQALYTTAVPTAAQLQAGYNTLVQNTGIAVSYQQYQNSILGQPLATRQAFINIVKAHGLHYLHDKIIAQLNLNASFAANWEQNGANLYHASYDVRRGRLQNTCFDEVPDDGNADGEGAMLTPLGRSLMPVAYQILLTGTTATPPWISIAGLYLTVVALAVSGPVGWGIAAAGAALTGVGLVSGC